MMRRTILLVEDDELLRDTTRDALESRYHVFEASKYSEGIEQSRNHIDLALIDYMLPDYNGFELLKEIRKEKPELPAIIMTGYSCEDVAIKAVRAGATDYIKKPFKIAYLMRRISEILKEDDSRDGIECEHAENKEDFIMDGIAVYIEKHYNRLLTLGELAERAGMNKFKFCRLFKEKFGRSFISYLNALRIRTALDLLKNSDLNISEIAFFVGFRSIDCFERVFKKLHGVSPRQYRQKFTAGQH